MMARFSRWLAPGVAAAVCLSGAEAALGHPGHLTQEHSAWAAGLLHPITGLDHLLAMLASGLLAVRVGTRRALWVVPLSFVGLMLFGGVLAYAGVPLPGVEWGIALSVIVLGAAVAALPRAPLGVSAALVGLFAIFHGHAHVAELGGHALLPYVVGFALMTLALHAAAIGVGRGAQGSLQTQGKSAGIRPRIVQFTGAAIAVGFALVLFVG